MSKAEPQQPNSCCPNNLLDDFEQQRAYLFAIAYRMTGSVMEAEDILHDAYLRYRAVPREAVQSPRALLATIVTRLCLNHMQSARVRRERYPGPWLPEPLPTDPLADDPAFGDPAHMVEQQESVSMAFLVLLEALTPAERAVFLLREVFDYDYAEIADVVEKSEAACRQLFHRARQHINAHRPRFTVAPAQHEAMLNRFLLAVTAGELEPLEQLLAEEVVFQGDGGGKVRGAALRPVHGRAAVARLALGIFKRRPPQTQVTVEPFNGRAAMVTRIQGVIFAVTLLEIVGEEILAIRNVANPDKLAHL